VVEVGRRGGGEVGMGVGDSTATRITRIACVLHIFAHGKKAFCIYIDNTAYTNLVKFGQFF